MTSPTKTGQGVGDERLAHLIRRAEHYAKANRLTGSPIAASESQDTAEALRELQRWRHEAGRLQREVEQMASLAGSALHQLHEAVSPTTPRVAP
jgi:protein-disulfide isomerase-like protein with CxxC motif